MDKPTTAFIKTLLLLTSLSFTASTTCYAQMDGEVIDSGYSAGYSRAGSYFNRQLGTALRFGYQTEGYGVQKGIVTLGSMKVFNFDGATLNMDAQATLSDDFGAGYNAGVFYRTLKDLGIGPDSQRIYGLGFWSDGQSTSADNFFNQLGVTLESLGDSYDLRFQGNFPLERREDGDRYEVIGADPVYEGNFLMSDIFEFKRDTSLTTIDFEGAKRIMNLEAWAFLGGYHLSGGPFDATGYRAGVRGYAVPDLALSLQVTDDDLYDTNVMFGITWFVGRTSTSNQPCGNVLDRFREPVIRNNYIATVQTTLRDAENPYTDAVTGDEFFFVHVDSNAADGGDGTFENPFNDPNDVNNGSAPGNIILAHAESEFTGSFVLQEDQRLLGEGLDPNGNQVDHIINTAEDGLVVLPETSLGAKDGMRPIINALLGTGDPNNPIFAITMADDTEANNFDIIGNAGGSDGAVLADDVNAPQLANLDIDGPFEYGVVFREVTGSALIENSVTIDETEEIGMHIVGGSSTIGANATVTNSEGRSVVIEDRQGGTVTVGAINDTGEGILVQNNDAGDITFSSLADLDTDADQAVTLLNNNGATITFQELQANSAAGDTVVVRGGGNINVNSSQGDGSDIINTGTGSALVVQGDDADPNLDASPTVNIAGDIVNGGGGYVADIQEMDSGGVTVSGTLSDPNGDGLGLLVQNNSGGTFSFNGATRLNTGDNTAATFRNNSGATVSINDLQARSNDADTFLVVGGGSITVNDPNDSGFITNTGTGSAVVVRGDDDPNATGNPNLTINPDVNNNGGGLAVDIQDLTGGSVDINGDVNDPNGGGGILVQNNENATIDFDGNTDLDTGSSTAVRLIDNSGSTIDFQNLMATAEAGDTFVVQGGGTISVADPNGTAFIENTGSGSALVVRGDDDPNATGNPDLTVLADVNNSGGGFVTDIQGMTSGSVLISGDVNDPNSGGEGIHLENNSGGQFTFGGTTTITSSGTNNAVTMLNNDGSTTTFSDLRATAVDGNTVQIQGGGMVTFNDPNDNSFITNTGTGTALLVEGDSAAGASGDPNVTVNMNITNSGGGRSVNISDLTSNGVAINGTVNDTGNGVLVEDNSGDAVIRFNDTVTVDTSTGNAVELSNNTDADISFNGLDLTVTGGGEGFTATGGGNLAVQNTNGTTIQQNDSGTALRLSDMTIIDPNDGGNAVFDVVNVPNGTADAIFLQNIDGTGQVIIGSGDDPNEGGHLVTTSTAIVVDNVSDLDVSNIRIANTTGNGVLVTNQAASSSAVFDGMDIDTTNGDGITVEENSDGAIAFRDVTVDATGTGDAVFNSNNGSAIVNYTDLAATSGDGDTFTVQGAGTISVLDDATTSSITNNGAGSAVLISGNGGPGTGNPTVSIAGTIDNSGGGRSLNINNVAGDRTITVTADITDDSEGILIDTNQNATINFGGDIALNTGANDALTIQNNNRDNTSVTFNASSQLDIDTTAGGRGLIVLNSGPVSILGTGNTIDTQTDIAVDIDNSRSVRIDNTTVNSNGAIGVDINHGIAQVMSVTLNNVTITDPNATAVEITANGSGELDVIMDDITITNNNFAGITLDTGANANRVDLSITGASNVSVGDASAFDATLDDSDIANVRLLVQGDEQQFTNDSGSDATFNILVDSGMTVSATIGEGPTTVDPNDPTNTDPPAAPIGDSNRFANAGSADAFVFNNNDTGTVNLDLRDNEANSTGGNDFDLISAVGGTFNLVDRDDTIAGDNNLGTVNTTGTFNNIVPPVQQPTAP